MDQAPRILPEAIAFYADAERCHTAAVALRWPDGVTCPHCHCPRHSFYATRRIWRCHECKRQFSIKVGTIFEDSPLGMDKWIAAVWMLVACENGISSYELGRALHITQKSAWFMLHRVRLAMQSATFAKLAGPCEADETFAGGKARNRHKASGR